MDLSVATLCVPVDVDTISEFSAASTSVQSKGARSNEHRNARRRAKTDLGELDKFIIVSEEAKSSEKDGRLASGQPCGQAGETAHAETGTQCALLAVADSD